MLLNVSTCKNIMVSLCIQLLQEPCIHCRQIWQVNVTNHWCTVVVNSYVYLCFRFSFLYRSYLPYCQESKCCRMCVFSVLHTPFRGMHMPDWPTQLPDTICNTVLNQAVLELVYTSSSHFYNVVHVLFMIQTTSSFLASSSYLAIKKDKCVEWPQLDNSYIVTYMYHGTIYSIKTVMLSMV